MSLQVHIILYCDGEITFVRDLARILYIYLLVDSTFEMLDMIKSTAFTFIVLPYSTTI